MRFKIQVPKGVKSGQTVRIKCPDGSTGDIKIPHGLKEGESFMFEMNVDDEDAVREAQKRIDRKIDGGGSDGRSQQGTSSRSRRRQAAGGGGGGGGGSAATTASVTGTAISAAATTKSAASAQNCAFLDREIVDLRDLVAALGVGMLIGVSIVMGFLVGVLYVTSNPS